MTGMVNVVQFWMLMVCVYGFQQCGASDDSYENISHLMEYLLGPESGYNSKLRPLNNQSDQMVITVTFAIISLDEINDVKQSFTVNGFMSFEWKDERVSWDKRVFNTWYINPDPTDVWRPRLVLLNTLGDRDTFKDDYSPLLVYFTGLVWWMPGGIFKASCGLDMRKYPFDQQSCRLTFCAMSYEMEHVTFETRNDHIYRQFFTYNEEWEITDSLVNVTHAVSVKRYGNISCIDIIIYVRRRSSYYMLNFILPVLMLSFLNNFVFLIPDESGEKIGYGITVLLSVAVYLTTVSTMIPRATDKIPAATIYLFALLLFSVLSVLASIATVYLQNIDEPHDETEHFKYHQSYASAVKNAFNLRQNKGRKVCPQQERDKANNGPRNISSLTSVKTIDDFDDATVPQNKRYRTITKHINKICFVASLFFWVMTQIVYFIYVNA